MKKWYAVGLALCVSAASMAPLSVNAEETATAETTVEAEASAAEASTAEEAVEETAETTDAAETETSASEESTETAESAETETSETADAAETETTAAEETSAETAESAETETSETADTAETEASATEETTEESTETAESAETETSETTDAAETETTESEESTETGTSETVESSEETTEEEAEEEELASAEEAEQEEEYEIEEEDYAASDDGSAYAVLLTSDSNDYTANQLVMIRSTQDVDNNTTTSITSIDGDTFTGHVYDLYEEGTTYWWGNIESGTSTYKDYADDITACYVVDSISLESCASLFSGLGNCTTIDISNLDTSNCTTFRNMFASDSSLTTIKGLDQLDTSNGKSFERMFYHCSELTEIDVSNFDTSSVLRNNQNVIDHGISQMFTDCTSVTELDLSNFDLSNLSSDYFPQDYYYVFSNCSSLQVVYAPKALPSQSSGISLPDTFYEENTSTGELNSTKYTALPSVASSYYTPNESMKLVRGRTVTWLNYLLTLSDGTYYDKGTVSGYTTVTGTNDTLFSTSIVPYGTDVSGYHPQFYWYTSDEDDTVMADLTNVVDDLTVYGKGVALYRLYNPNSGEHFYTKDANERDNLVEKGWTYENIGWYAPIDNSDGTTPVYRLYNQYGGEHHYTVNESEKEWLVSIGWTDEGIGWYSGGDTVLYRVYNPNAYANNHHYTTSAYERDNLLSIGWDDEGTAWNGVFYGAQTAD